MGIRDRYPDPAGPKTQTEMLAWLFTLLAASYGKLHHYETQELRRETEDIAEVLRAARDERQMKLQPEEGHSDETDES